MQYDTIKGSPGLEALATLCGGASKAPDNEPSQNIDSSKKGAPKPQTTDSSQLEQFSNNASISYANKRQINDSSNPQQQQQNNMSHNQMNPQVAALINAGLSQQNIGQQNVPLNDNGAMALQQMVYLNLLQNQNVSNLFNQQQQAPSPQFVDQNALAIVLALQQQQQAKHESVAANHFQSQLQHEQQQSQFQAIIPPPPQNSTKQHQSNNNNSNSGHSISQTNTFPAPHPKIKNEVPHVGGSSSSSGATLHQPILMRHPQGDISDISAAAAIHGETNKASSTVIPKPEESIEGNDSTVYHPEDKKLQKRAANRRSAQLSRKRKKQYIEDLKEENADLRRMELILRSIPDLVVSFDSSGKIGFVSQSVSKFLQFTPDELEGKSFWDRLCEDSVKLLKAAFMDALAARENESTTTPLGAGVWELRLQDKNKETIMVTLNGVVHFTGDAPECVCSIRLSVGKSANTRTYNHAPPQKLMKPSVLPQQSVFTSGPSIPPQQRFQTQNSAFVQSSSGSSHIGGQRNQRNSAQISDVDSSSTGD
mmetsp:Transcript_17766/g.22405  ORF Transcript_17766/g.22405 Transcript_17766/m.22405 type:complete len:537 (+) Transcript_17766:62-1672(+)